MVRIKEDFLDFFLFLLSEKYSRRVFKSTRKKICPTHPAISFVLISIEPKGMCLLVLKPSILVIRRDDTSNILDSDPLITDLS